MRVDVAPMIIADYDEVFALWQGCDGIGLHDFEDSREGVALYLDRNPEMSFVARKEGRLVGAVLCGHDGRRGYLNHLAVHPEFRRHGIARILVDMCLSELRNCRIRQCNIVVFRDNTSGREMWSRLSWIERDSLVRMQCSTVKETVDQ